MYAIFLLWLLSKNCSWNFGGLILIFWISLPILSVLKRGYDLIHIWTIRPRQLLVNLYQTTHGGGKSFGIHEFTQAMPKPRKKTSLNKMIPEYLHSKNIKKQERIMSV